MGAQGDTPKISWQKRLMAGVMEEEECAQKSAHKELCVLMSVKGFIDF